MPKNVEVKTETTTMWKEEFMRLWEQEYQTTMRLLKAYPEDKLNLRPHSKLRTAGELAWSFTNGEAWMVNGCITGKFDMGGAPQHPESMKEIIANFERVHQDAMNKVRNMSESDLEKTVKFFTGPKQISDVKCKDLLNFMILDQVHHRGQMSIYLRIAGGMVPSVYGPTADEPWT